MLQSKTQFLTWIHTGCTKTFFHTVTTEDQTVTSALQQNHVTLMKTRTWHCQNWSQKCNANLNTQVKNNKSFNTIMLRANQACTEAMQMQSGPLGPQSRNVRPSHAAPYRSAHLITGPLRAAEVLEWAHPPTCDSTQTLQADTLNSRPADAGFSRSHTYTPSASSSYGISAL